MPRRKIQMGLISKAGPRARAFTQRKKGLQKKAFELAELCGVDVALVVGSGGPGSGAEKPWEFGSAGVIDRYRRLPADKRAKHTHLGYLNVELGKEKATLAKERQKGPKALASPGKQELEGVDLEELLGSIDAALLATAQRRKALGMPDDDGGDQLQQAAPDAIVPLGQGVPVVGDGGFDDDLEAWVDELTGHDVEPQPLNACMMTQPAPARVQYVNGGVEPRPFNSSMMTQPAPARVQYVNGGVEPRPLMTQPAPARVQYINGGVEPRPFNSSMMQPASGVQYTSCSSLGLGGNPTPLQQMGGNNGENDHGQLAWGAYQPHNTVSFPDHSFQYTGGSNYSYTGMDGCPQMPTPMQSNANGYNGYWLNQNASLHITCHPFYIPPEHSSMGTTGSCYSSVSAIGMDGSSFMDASGHEYETQCLADYFPCPNDSQHLGVEPLHYFSDVAEDICYYEHEAGGSSSGSSQPFAQSHNSSGTLNFCSDQYQSDARDQALQRFWAMEEAAGFNQAAPVRCAAS